MISKGYLVTFHNQAMAKSVNIPDDVIAGKIYEIRGQKVMIDRDLAALFDVETRSLKQAVRRNIRRFPEDFMFEMTDAEFQDWRSQSLTTNADRMGLRYAPFCFSEQGVTMLSCVLNSDLAIEMNIRIIRVFVQLKRMLTISHELVRKLEEIEARVADHDESIELIFDYLKKLIEEPVQPRRTIGYRRHDEGDQS